MENEEFIESESVEEEKHEEEKEVEKPQEKNASVYLWVKTFPVTSLAILISVVIFFLVEFYTRKYGESYARVMFGWGTGPLLWHGEIWRLIVNVFQHGNFSHLLLNCFAMGYLGFMAEAYLGKIKFLLFIIFCGFFQSAICEITIEPGAIGISGVVYGIFGFLVMIREKDPLIYRVISPEFIKMMIIMLFVSVGITVIGLLPIANVGHFSGFTYGLLFGLMFYKHPKLINRFTFILINICLIFVVYYAYKPVYNTEWQMWHQSER